MQINFNYVEMFQQILEGFQMAPAAEGVLANMAVGKVPSAEKLTAEISDLNRRAWMREPVQSLLAAHQKYKMAYKRARTDKGRNALTDPSAKTFNAVKASLSDIGIEPDPFAPFFAQAINDYFNNGKNLEEMGDAGKLIVFLEKELETAQVGKGSRARDTNKQGATTEGTQILIGITSIIKMGQRIETAFRNMATDFDIKYKKLEAAMTKDNTWSDVSKQTLALRKLVTECKSESSKTLEVLAANLAHDWKTHMDVSNVQIRQIARIKAINLINSIFRLGVPITINPAGFPVPRYDLIPFLVVMKIAQTLRNEGVFDEVPNGYSNADLLDPFVARLSSVAQTKGDLKSYYTKFLADPNGQDYSVSNDLGAPPERLPVEVISTDID